MILKDHFRCSIKFLSFDRHHFCLLRDCSRLWSRVETMKVNCWLILHIFGTSWWSSNLGHALFKIMDVIVIIKILFFVLCKGIPYFFQKPSSICPHSRVCAFEHIKCAWLSVACQFVISVDPLVLLHHENFRIHLRLLKSLTSQFRLEISCRCRIYSLYMIECGLDLLLLEFAFVLHKVFSLIM